MRECLGWEQSAASLRALDASPPASGTPQVPLGDGRRGPAGQRQDKQVNASGGTLYGPSLRPRVEAGPSLGGSWTKAATPTSLNWDCGERCRLHQGVVCAGTPGSRSAQRWLRKQTHVPQSF
uniref:Uncharacterized protein n=1 Tax=Rousettus aegyptiacus TaxID=9407 RepID=A0A7J8DFD5_ROUAE|nr:hypothetical protein HJG63_000539 [Rousettus aegyptiacus]